jgi:hypothetical protein
LRERTRSARCAKLAGHGRLHADRHGYPFAQVFAPPGEAFVCFEPMTATERAHAPRSCPLVEAYDAAFAVEVGSTMSA